MANRTLLARRCNSTPAKEYYWDLDARTAVSINYTASSCTAYNLPKGTLIDSWFEGSTKVEIFTTWDGTGRPPQTAAEYVERVETVNDPGGNETPCGLKIDDVQVSGTGDEYIITIFTSGYSGAIEYSLNGFQDVQDSNVFTLSEPGSFVAHARAKR